MTRYFRAFCGLLLAAAVFARSPAVADEGLYNDLGGREGIERFIGRMYDYILVDDRIKAEFADNDINRLKHMISDYVCQAVGGPCVYKGADMRLVHKGVHATEADFNALVEDLQRAMDDSDISFRTQNRLLAILAPVEHDVVTN